METPELQEDYVMLEFVGTGSQKRYRPTTSNRTYWVGGNVKLFACHKEDASYFLELRKNRNPQFIHRKDFVYKKDEEKEVSILEDDNEIEFEEYEPQISSELTELKYVGESTANKLKEAGYHSTADLQRITLEKFIEITDMPKTKAENVLGQANVQVQE